MNEAAALGTWDILLELGFVPVADPMQGLVFDFGNFKLRATSLINLQFAEVVAFNGVVATPNTIAEIDFEMPRGIESRATCVAWIIWHLDKAANGGVFHPGREVGWVAEGRQHEHLLPWVIRQANRKRSESNYRRLPHCHVHRDWLKLALNTLANYLRDLSDETPVVFSFTDSVLTIRFNERVIALAGNGHPWLKQYTIPAGQLRQPRKRIMRAYIEVSVCDDRLRIGNQVFTGIREDQP